MSRAAIAAHVAIAGVSFITGWLSEVIAGFQCVYGTNQPFSSTCGAQWIAFLKFAALTAVCLYVFWGIARLLRRSLASN